MIELATIQKCLKGNQAAYKKAYNESLPYVLSVVSRYIYEPSQRPDVVQSVYIQLFNSLKRYDKEKGSVKSFVRIITVNCCLTHLKKQSKKPIIHTLSVVSESAISSEEENKLLELSKEDILDLLKDMPQGYKIVFLLCAIDGFSHKEIADQLKITPETSRSQYFRAKKWLIKKFNNSTLIKSYGIF